MPPFSTVTRAASPAEPMARLFVLLFLFLLPLRRVLLLRPVLVLVFLVLVLVVVLPPSASPRSAYSCRPVKCVHVTSQALARFQVCPSYAVTSMVVADSILGGGWV